MKNILLLIIFIGIISIGATVRSGGGITSSGADKATGWTKTGTNVYTTVGTDNVGIGSNSPSDFMTIANTASKGITLTGSSGTILDSVSNLVLQSATNNVYARAATGGSFIANDLTNANVLLASGGGNVGIGTTLPRNKLEATGNITATKSAGNSYFEVGDVLGNDMVRLQYDSTGKYGYVNSFSGGVVTKLALNPTGGNVGIGTSLPAYSLQVRNGSAAGSLGITVNNVLSSFGRDVIFTTVPDSSASLAGYEFVTNNGSNVNAMVINAAGNVGIGTTVPGQLLTIKEGASIPVIQLTNGTIIHSIGRASNFLGTGINTDLAIAAATSNNLLFGIGSSEKMRIDSNGNVGIGTIVPSAPLEVSQGAAGILNRLIAFPGTGTNRTLTIDNPTGVQAIQLQSTITSSAAVGNLLLNPSGGNIGIGSVNPGQKLDVTGDIRGNGFSTAGTGEILCVKSNGSIGTCSVGVVGVTCTCS